MQTILLFTDAATSPQLSLSVGAFLFLKQEEFQSLASDDLEKAFSKIAEKIIFTQFISKKSTWSEIKNFIAAIEAISKIIGPSCYINVYTDCQGLVDLVTCRKEKLQKKHFITSKGKILEHADLYKELFTITEKYCIRFSKVKGHNKMSAELSLEEKIFLMVDKLSRKELRRLLKNPE